MCFLIVIMMFAAVAMTNSCYECYSKTMGQCSTNECTCFHYFELCLERTQINGTYCSDMDYWIGMTDSYCTYNPLCQYCWCQNWNGTYSNVSTTCPNTHQNGNNTCANRRDKNRTCSEYYNDCFITMSDFVVFCISRTMSMVMG